MKIDPYILTISGNHFDYVEMDYNVLNIEEIAHALANTCRFGGHCREYYSVAQHSVLVARYVPVDLARDALFHDAAEAYLGDMPTPLKQLLPDYKAMTDRVEYWIQKKLGINIEHPEIKKADLQVLGMEKRDLMPHDDTTWAILNDLEIPEEVITPMDPVDAYNYFMEEYYQIAKIGEE